MFAGSQAKLRPSSLAQPCSSVTLNCVLDASAVSTEGIAASVQTLVGLAEAALALAGIVNSGGTLGRLSGDPVRGHWRPGWHNSPSGGAPESKMADMTLLSGNSSVKTSETPLANPKASGRDWMKDLGYSKSRGREILGQS